ncbi:MAG TPA: AI-2E family transporter, partial [Candidatus Avipropionibacterium avicola]|nr:AI-2E family transporter [Candidatus Avipropionibacterium avicola]
MGSRVHPGPRRTVLLQQRSPLAIGFMFTVGALIAIALAQTALVAQHILIVIMLALFLALGLNPVVTWLISKGLPRGAAVVTVVFGALAVFALALWAIIPVVIRQLTTLVTDGPVLLQQTRNHPWIRDLDERFDVISRLVAALSDPNLANQLFGGVLGAGQVVVG